MNQFKKISVLGIVIIAAVFVLSGCKSTSDKAAEKVIEKVTNGQADVDSSTNTVTMNYNGGSLQAGGAVSMPSGFPSDVYVVDGTLTSAVTMDETNGYSISLETTQSVDQVKSTYETELRNAGWTITSSSLYMGSAAIFSTKDNRSCNIGASIDVNKTRVSINTFSNLATNTSDNN